MPTLPNMGLITPTLGGDSGTWDDKINACLALIDAHDHTSGKGVAVPVAGLDIDADFAMAGHAVTGLGSIAFNAVTALTSGTKRLFVSSSDNELYWRTNAGTNVKLTSGTSINTTLVGGIVGDYASVGAEVAYDDANDRYTFKDESSPSKKWSRIASGPIRIFEYNTTESVYVEHAVAAGLAAPYTVTWPAALPGSPPNSALMQITSAGVVSFSNTLTDAVTATDFLFTTEKKLIVNAASIFHNQVLSGFRSSSGSGELNFGNSTGDYFIVPVNLHHGDRVKSFTIYMYKASDNTNTISGVFKTATQSGGPTTITTASTASNAPGNHSFTSSALTTTISSTSQYWIEIHQSDGTPSGTDTICWAVINYDRPV